MRWFSRVLRLHHARMVRGACSCRGDPAGETKYTWACRDVGGGDGGLLAQRWFDQGVFHLVVLSSSCADQLQVGDNDRPTEKLIRKHIWDATMFM